MGDATAKHAGDVAQVKLFKAGQGESMLATLRSDLQATADQRMAAGVSDGSALRPASEYTAWDTEGWAGVNPGMDRWHEFLSAAVAKAKAGKQATEAEDRESFSRLKALMHPQVRFHPPTYWKPKEGSLFAAVILREVSQVFGGSFRYHRQFQDEAGLNFVLEFSAMIEDVCDALSTRTPHTTPTAALPGSGHHRVRQERRRRSHCRLQGRHPSSRGGPPPQAYHEREGWQGDEGAVEGAGRKAVMSVRITRTPSPVSLTRVSVNSHLHLALTLTSLLHLLSSRPPFEGDANEDLHSDVRMRTAPDRKKATKQGKR